MADEPWSSRYVKSRHLSWSISRTTSGSDCSLGPILRVEYDLLPTFRDAKDQTAGCSHRRSLFSRLCADDGTRCAHGCPATNQLDLRHCSHCATRRACAGTTRHGWVSLNHSKQRSSKRMTQALPSTIKAKEKLRSWVAVGGLSGLRTTVSKAGRELSWVLLGKFCLMGANAGLMLFLANRLDLNTYGLLVITISAQLLISRLLMLGVDAGIVRLTAMSDLRSLSREVVSAGLVAIICTSTILLVLVLLITPVLSILGIPVWLIACITAGSIGTSFVDYGYSFRLARHEYAFAAVTQGGTALWRLALTTLASVILVAHPIAVFIAYHAASFVSGLAQAFLIFARKWQQPGKALTRRLLGYSFWQAKANV